MASHREQVILAIVALVEAALPHADVKRNRSETIRAGAGGAVSIEDGDPGEPEQDLGLGEPVYNYSHVIPLRFLASQAVSLDEMHAAVGAAIRADRTLGGLCDYIQAVAPEGDPLDLPGADALAQSDAAIIADYATRSPL